MSSIDPVMGSFQIARAYQAGMASAPRPAVRPSAGTEAEAVEPKLSPNVRKLVAGVVPGRVSFGSDPTQNTVAIAMYRHPADKNAAATAVSAGKMIDITA